MLTTATATVPVSLVYMTNEGTVCITGDVDALEAQFPSEPMHSIVSSMLPPSQILDSLVNLADFYNSVRSSGRTILPLAATMTHTLVTYPLPGLDAPARLRFDNARLARITILCIFTPR
jgi:hypothetical protein